MCLHIKVSRGGSISRFLEVCLHIKVLEVCRIARFLEVSQYKVSRGESVYQGF